MNTDIRLKVGFLDNPKVVKLQRRLGAEAVLSLIRLWIYTAENKPDGILDGLDSEDIEIACCWTHADSILTALLDVKLLEQTNNGYIIHDWDDHNPWAAKANSRSEQAREAARKRWDKKGEQKQEVNADRMPSASEQHADRNAPYLSLPSPTLQEKPPLPKKYKGDFDSIWEQYPKKDGKKEALRHFTATVKTEQDMIDIQTALDNYKKQVEGTDKKYIKNGSTWFNNWQDFIETDNNQPEERNWV